MQREQTNHYATLGLDHRCAPAQIRAAYRILARQHHPDLNPDSPAAVGRTQELNAAYAVLSDPVRRLAYDRECAAAHQPANRVRASKAVQNISQVVQLRIEEFLRGVTLEVRVNDPGNPHGPETYPLVVPPETAPGTRFRLARQAPFEGCFILVKAGVRPDLRFKVRGSDVRCDLRIKLGRVTQGGTETLRGVTGVMVRVEIPRGIGRGEIIRVPGEGLPKPRGGRGDLLVRILYRPEVRITHTSRR